MDVPGESMNTLKAAFADGSASCWPRCGNRDLIGLVIVSGKKDSLHRRGRHRHAGGLRQRPGRRGAVESRAGGVRRIESLGIPVIAAIHGPASAAGWSWRSPAMAGW